MSAKTDRKTALRVATWSASLIAVVGGLWTLAVLRELMRSGSQDAMMAVFTSGLILAGTYGIYQMNRIATSAMVVFSMLLVLMTVMDASAGLLGVAGMVVFTLIVACGAVAAWTAGPRKKRHSHHHVPHVHVP
jgi:hypothetical protein